MSWRNLGSTTMVVLAVASAAFQFRSARHAGIELFPVEFDLPVPPPMVQGGIDSDGRVMHRYTRTLDNECVYDSFMGGVIAPDRGPDGVATLSPDITVTSSVRCPNGTTVVSAREVRGRNMILGDVSEALQAAGTVSIEPGETRCLYVPRFRLESSRTLSVQNLEQWCPLAAETNLPSGDALVRSVDRFERTVAGDCVHRSTVASDLAARASPEGVAIDRRSGPLERAASVQVQAEVACQRSVVGRSADRVVSTSGLDERALERSLGESASVSASAAGRDCVYSPSYHVDQGFVSSGSVASHCELAAASVRP